MGRPIKKFIRYELLKALKNPQPSIQDENESLSEFLLENTNNGDLNKEQIDDTKEGIVESNFSKELKEEIISSQSNKGTTYLESLMLFLKANIGSGVLAMPYGFKNSGLIFGSISLWLMGIICTMCIHMLINCYKHVIIRSNLTPNSSNKRKSNEISYEEIVYLVVKEKCKFNSKYPVYAKLSITFFLVLSQFGCGCVYIVFIATNIKQVIDFYYPNTSPSSQLIMCYILLPLILYFLIKNLKTLAFFSTIANLLISVSMIIILYDLCFSMNLSFKPIGELDMITWPPNKWPIFFSFAIYAFEGIPLTMPVYNEMKIKSAFDSSFGVLNIGMSLVAVVYFIIGFFGYLKYGKEVHASITLDLPIKNVLFQIIKLLYSLAIFISYNLQFSVASNTIWAVVHGKRFKSLKNSNIAHNLFRSFLVFLSFLFAICVPKIELFIALFGAISASTLAIIIPCMLDLILFWPLSNYSLLKLTKNTCLIIFGFYIFFAGCYTSILDIINYYKKM